MTAGHDLTLTDQVASRAITYNADNMPTQISHSTGGTVDFVYDGDGVRSKKAVQGGDTTYYINGQYEVKNGAATVYIFAGNLRIAQKTGLDRKYFHKDHLGSSTVITDAAGVLVLETSYMPFGAERFATGNRAAATYKYTDQEKDTESGLYNYGARLYDPVIGRFITPDTIVPDPTNPQALNRYSYVINNPLKYTDPTGHGFFSKLWKKIKGPVIAAATAFVLTGGNPVAAVAAATSTAALDTGEGRKAVRFVGKQVFDDIIGINNPKVANMLAYITLDAAMTWGMTSAYNRFAETPKGTIGKDPVDIKDPQYAEFIDPKNMGKKAFDTGRNVRQIVESGGNAYPVYGANGDVLGLYAQGGAFGTGNLGAKLGFSHGAVVLRSPAGGYVNSMTGLRGWNIYGITSTSHQMVNQAFLRAGNALTISAIPGSGWFTYATSAIYGPYGSAAPVLGYYEAERLR